MTVTEFGRSIVSAVAGPDIRSNETHCLVASTTSWGNADPLDRVLQRIANRTEATVVELAIGAKPISNPHDVIDRWRDRFEFIGHHTIPLGENENLRPTIGNHKTILSTCKDFALTSYSGHPPNKKHSNWNEFLGWASSYHDLLVADGISFAVETMYVPRLRSEHVTTGGYHLATPKEVFDFCLWAENFGWKKPLLVDASHLHIGYCGGQWAEKDIKELLASTFISELHISENDGMKDSHRPLTPSHKVSTWLENLDMSTISYVVDEGRRRPSPISYTSEFGT